MTLTGLALWLSNRFTTIANQLGFVDADYGYIVSDTLELLDIASESDVSAIKLHAVAVYKFWVKCSDIVSLDYSFSADGSSYSRSDMFDMVSKNLQKAETEAMAYLPNYRIDIGTLTNVQDPYSYNKSRDELGNF